MPTTSGSIAVAGFPGFDEPSPMSLGATYPSTSALSTMPTGRPYSGDAPFATTAVFAQPSTASVDLASVDYEPMTRTWGSQRSAGAFRPATGSTTGGVWMLALSPLLVLALGALGWWLTEGGTTATTAYVAGGFGVITLLFIVTAAISDYRRLGALGHEHRASVAWIVAGPFFYLLVRAIHVHRTMRSGTAPAWVFVALALAVAAAIGALALLAPRDAGLTELRAVEEQITADMQAQGLNYSMLCPSEASAAVGSSFVCTAYDEVGPVALVRVTWSGLGEFTYSVE